MVVTHGHWLRQYLDFKYGDKQRNKEFKSNVKNGRLILITFDFKIDRKEYPIYIYFMRHALSCANVKGEISKKQSKLQLTTFNKKIEQIGISDPPLADLGIEDMKKLGNKLYTLKESDTNIKILYNELLKDKKYVNVFFSGMHRTLETLAYFLDSFLKDKTDTDEIDEIKKKEIKIGVLPYCSELTKVTVLGQLKRLRTFDNKPVSIEKWII